MPKKSKVWKYFTRLDGEDAYKATCNKCGDGKKFDISGGTSNLWRHLVRDFTHIDPDDQGDEQGTVLQCDICKRKLYASVTAKTKNLKASADISSLAEHVMACIERQKGASRPPRVQMRALPGSGSTSMDIEPADPQAQPSLLMQTRLPVGSGSSSMDLLPADPFFKDNLPADLRAQLPPPPSALSCPTGSSLDGELGLGEPSKCLARMIALGGHDPSIVDDVNFRMLLLSLKPEFMMPSRDKIEEECDRIFDEARSDLLSRLSSSRRRVSLAVGRTKTFDKEFIYVTCNFIDDGWMLHKLVIQAFMVVDDDEPPYNASVLGMEMTIDDPDMFTVLDHISNRCNSNRLSMLTITSETNDRDCIQNRHLNSNTRTREIFCATYVDKVLHAIAKCFLPEYEGWFDSAMPDHVEALQLTRENRQQLISHLGLDDPWMYHDEKWYAKYCCLKLLRMESYTATDTNSIEELLVKVCGQKYLVMHYYMNSRSDYLCKVWEKIHHAIQRISASSYPTSHLCFEILLNMWEFFQSDELAHLPDDNIHDTRDISFFLCMARQTLDRAIKDSYLVWSIPLALDPRYKLRHIRSIFEAAYKSEEAATEYMSEITKKIIELYTYYRKDEDGISTGAGHSDNGVAVAVAADGADWDGPMQVEWQRYLSDPAPPVEDFDILKWWKGNSQKYPTLARMARDALAMPTCSKPSYDEVAQIRSIARGYMKPFRLVAGSSSSSSSPSSSFSP